jgi:YD repeat-containing protein
MPLKTFLRDDNGRIEAILDDHGQARRVLRDADGQLIGVDDADSDGVMNRRELVRFARRCWHELTNNIPTTAAGPLIATFDSPRIHGVDVRELLDDVSKFAAADLTFWLARPQLDSLSFAVANEPIELMVRRT